MTDIQSMLVLGNVISNNMNAGVAWSFLGMLAHARFETVRRLTATDRLQVLQSDLVKVSGSTNAERVQGRILKLPYEKKSGMSATVLCS